MSDGPGLHVDRAKLTHDLFDIHGASGVTRVVKGSEACLAVHLTWMLLDERRMFFSLTNFQMAKQVSSFAIVP